MAAEEEVLTLDPTKSYWFPESIVLGQVYEALFRINGDEEIEPWLASSYKASDQLTKWSFQLRPGVKFSDGTPLTAADVTFSLNRMRHDPVLAPLYESIDSVKEGPNDSVTITTSQPSPVLPDELSLLGAAILPKNFGGESEKHFFEHPVGTGSFEIESSKKGEPFAIKKNPRYWRKGFPYLDKIIYTAVPSDSSRISQLKAGDLDAIARPAFSQLSGLENYPGTQVLSAEDAWTSDLLLNSHYPLWGDPRAREAVNLGLNRDDITEAAFRGYGKPAASFLPLFLKYLEPIPVPKQNATKAKKLLAEAVEATGAKPEFDLMYVVGEEYATNSVQVIQENLEEAGFTVTLRPVDPGAYGELIETAKYEAALELWGTGMADPIELTNYITGTEYVHTLADIERLEQLNQKANTATDPEEREQLYHEFQQTMAEEKFAIALNDSPLVWAARDDVTGFPIIGPAGITILSEAGFAG